MVTMKDIAEKAGVSAATVSRILGNKTTSIPISEKTRKKMLAVAKDTGYRPNVFAQSLRTRKSFLVGVVLWDLTEPFFSEILRGIEQVVDQSGYSLLLTTAEARKDREGLCLEKLSTFRTDGILIVSGPKRHAVGDLERFGVERGTVVLVDTRAEEMEVSSITVDNVDGGYIGAKYLIGLGRRNITYIASQNKTFDMEDRLQGVQRAIDEFGARDRFHVVDAGPGEQEGYEITERMLTNTEPPVAIFAVNDVTALGALRACVDRGLRIPQDAAVLGFDDLSMAQYLSPRLSTIHQPRLQMGRDGAKHLLQLVERAESGAPTKHLNRVLTPRLVLRESA